jgi:putative ABC transport system permease protein
MRHHLIVLLRNFQREKLYTAINIAGLALGLGSCLLLGLFLRSELTYDRHYPNHRNIYRVVTEITTNGKPMTVAMAADAFGPMIVDEYPDNVLDYVRVRPASQGGGIALRRPEQPENVHYWENSYFADDNVFEVFPVEVVHGDPKTALVEGASVAISQTVARKYFGDENPIGKQLVTDAGRAGAVTLVFRDQPANTHLKYDLLISYNQTSLQVGDTPTQRRQRLVAINGFTYLVMHPTFRPAEWQRVDRDFTGKYMGAELRGSKTEWRTLLQPLASTHMQTEAGYDRPNGNAAHVYGCAAVALIILLIACINYMNLATARATRRARSVAFCKILGASRVSLAAGFLAEALLFTVVALVLAVALVEVVLKFTPVVELFDNKVTLNVLREPVLGLRLVGIALVTGLLSGMYPALYQSSWAPLTALAGTRPAARGLLRMRELLVLVQFTISAAAIACTLLMMAQMHYVSTRPLGFERDHRLLLSVRGATTIEKIPAIRNELLRDASIRGVAVAQNTPADGNNSVDLRTFQIEEENGAMGQQMLSIQAIGQDYEQVMGLTITQGRDLSSRQQGDTGNNMLVNEALVRKMGWSNPIGKRLGAGGYGSGRVVGVVRDFNFKTLHHQIEPLVMTRLSNDMLGVPESRRPLQQRQLVLDIAPAEIRRALKHARQVMVEADPNHVVEHRFLDESLDALYRTERNLTRLIGIFAAISIFIACLGLFGLAAFTTEQRSREIGTRKVLGATAWQIVGLLARRILVLVLIASALAGVVAYFAVDEWLQGFAYKAGINPLIFLLAAAVAAAVAFATVASQCWRTANADPVQALRHT